MKKSTARPTKSPARRPKPQPAPRRLPSIATVTIHRAGALPAERRRTLGAWLRKQGALVEKHGTVYAARYTARYR